MSAAETAQILSFVFEIVAIIWGVFSFINKIGKRLSRLEAEFVPNHGSSLRDAINRIETKMAKLEGRFEQHVEETEE